MAEPLELPVIQAHPPPTPEDRGLSRTLWMPPANKSDSSLARNAVRHGVVIPESSREAPKVLQGGWSQGQVHSEFLALKILLWTPVFCILSLL